jgi:PAS domain S-box-containing protein
LENYRSCRGQQGRAAVQKRFFDRMQMKIPGSKYKLNLSAKLAIHLVLSMIMIFSVVGVLNLRMHKRHLMEGVYQNADQISDIIKRGTNLSMLKNERDRIYQIVNSIALEPGILKIRIYNKEGRISFSTEPAEVNMEVNMQADACIVCHGGLMPPADAPIYERARDYRNQEGNHVLGVISPIKNEPACIAAECHAHSPNQKVLGVLDVFMQLDKVDASQKEYETRFMWFVFLTIFIICLTSTIFIYFVVFRPVNMIVEGTKRAAEGDLDFKINLSSRDEIGVLAKSFNAMAAELKKSQHQLMSAKAYTDNIIRSMSNSLVIVDENAIIRRANKATCNLLEYTEEELIGQPLAMIFSEGHYEDIRIPDYPIRKFDNTTETAYLTKNRKKIYVLFSGSVVRDDNNNFQGVACMAQDISWQTEAMNAGHLAALGELAAGVAHEINNPMNSIINYAQVMIDAIRKNETLPEEIPATIIKEGDRVSSIVRSLLSFARAQDRIKRPLVIHDVLQETLALTETQLIKDGIVLKVDVPKTLPEIMGDFQEIQQVFINIINNARFALNEKYSAAHPDKELSIIAEKGDIDGRSAIKITFRDNGTGIPDNIIDKVVNPFFSTKPAGQGTGLGLAITHGIISDHDGKLIIDSRVGEFTSLSILLPVVEEWT